MYEMKIVIPEMKEGRERKRDEKSMVKTLEYHINEKREA